MPHLTQRNIRFAIFTLAAAVLLAGVASAQLHYIEEFTTTTFLDSDLTEAHWNTTDGVLEFPRFPITLRGAADTPSAARGIDIHGHLAYVADGYSGVQIVDISDPDAPTIIGSFNTSGYAYQVQVVGNHALVADWEHGLDILNVQVPSSPVLVSNVPTDNANLGLSVKGAHCFIADGGGGLRVVDISVPYLPTVVGTADIGAGSRVDVAGDVAYLAAGAQGLVLFDVSDPTSPVQLGAYDTPGSASDVVVAGDLAYVADNDGGLQIIDVSDPVNPALRGAWVSAGETRGLTLEGSWIYLANGGLGMRVIDVSDPAHPMLHDTVDLPSSTYDVAMRGLTGFATCFGSGLVAMTVAERPISPHEAGSHDTPGEARDVVLHGQMAYVADGSAGLTVMDLSDPADGVVRDNVDTANPATSVTVDGGVALVLCEAGGLLAFDVTDPDQVQGLSSLNLVYGPDVALNGNRAYVLSPAHGLIIFDVGNPAAMTLTATLPLAGAPRRLAVDGDVVYVAGSGGLVAVEVSDPASPYIMDTLAAPSQFTDVEIRGDHAYLADADDELVVVDINDPYALSVVAGRSNAFLFGSTEIVVDGDLALVITTSGNTLAADISDPAAPANAFGFYRPGEATGADIAGDFVVVAAGDLYVMQTRGRHVVSRHETAASLPYPTSGREIIRYRAFLDMTGEADIRAAGSCYVEGAYTIIDEAWTRTVYGPCTDILFYVDLDWRTRTVIDAIDLQWLEDSAVVHAITDVPGDQGGRIMVDVVRSGYDFADEPDLPVTQYGVWRRVDDPAVARMVVDQAGDHAELPGAAVAELDGSRYVTGRRGVFPDGVWALVASVPAVQQDHYLVEATTIADSSSSGGAWTHFVVTTHTVDPGRWFVTLPDSGYSVDNLAPTMPTNLVVDEHGDGVELDWDDAPEQDFDRFRVYRGETPHFEPDATNLMAEVVVSNWTDDTADPGTHHYKVTTVDHSGNESDAAGVGVAVAVPGVAAAFALHGAAPNPFNPSTEIRYSLAEAGPARLTVYDLKGRVVATLVDGDQAAGAHAVTWRGQDEAGRTLAAGVYLVQLRAGSEAAVQRVSLVK